MDPSALSREQKEEIAAAIIERQVRRARADPSDFIEYALLDDHGQPIEQKWFHREWQDILTRHDRAVIFSAIDHGKTTGLSIARPLWQLGRNPTDKGCIISDTAGQAVKCLTAVKANIEANELVHDVFPSLKRENFRTWRDDSILIEPDRPTTAKDFTIQAVGQGGAIMGARLNWILIDDVLNLDNTWTEDQRNKVIEWYQTTVLSRLVKGGKVWVPGTAWHPGDLMHWLEQTGEFHVARYPAVESRDDFFKREGREFEGELFDYDGEGRVPIWPEKWPAAALRERQRQLTPFRFAQQFMCRATDEALTPFTDSALAKCKLRGRGLPYSPDDWDGPVFTGVDLAAGRTRRHAQTVFFTVGLTDDGDRYVLDVRSGRWHLSQIEAIMNDVFARFGGIFMCEDNALQALLVQLFQRDSVIPVRPYTTTKKKADPGFGIEAIAVEMENGKWMVPNINGIVHPYVEKWMGECAAYNPRAHTGDHLMACFFAWEALRRFERRGGSVEVRLIGADRKEEVPD